MSAKEVKFGVDARDRMLRGVDILNNAVKVTLGPRAQCRSRQVVRRSPHHQGRVTVAKEIELDDKFENMGCADGARKSLPSRRTRPATAPHRNRARGCDRA